MAFTKQELDTLNETRKHIDKVRHLLHEVIVRLLARGEAHDASKLSESELPLFTKFTPKLKMTKYNSEEYKEYLKELKPALDHHYANNRHHPEHFPDGISGMNLLDLIEMICDWKASTLRQNNGNILTSIEQNSARFNIDAQLTQIFINTVKLFEQE